MGYLSKPPLRAHKRRWKTVRSRKDEWLQRNTSRHNRVHIWIHRNREITHCSCTGLSRLGPSTEWCKWMWVMWVPIPIQEVICTDTHLQRKKVYLTGYIDPVGPMPCSRWLIQNKLKAFIDFSSHTVLCGQYLSYWSSVCILWFLFVCLCMYASFLVLLVFLLCLFFKRERTWSWEGEQNLGGVGRKKHGQNILYEKKFSYKKYKKF